MNKVYKHKKFAIDEYLGWVDQDGKVYERTEKLDHYVGHVDERDGKVYEARSGPDQYIGRVDPDNGKVYLTKFGPDQYLGRVRKDGKLYHHKRLARDDYLGKVKEMTSLTHGGAAFLLLVMPAVAEAELEETKPEESKTDPQPPNIRR